MRKLLYIFIPFVIGLYSFGPASQTQTFKYDVIVYNRSIGTFTATRTDLNERSEYILESKISTRIFKQIDYEFTMHSAFENSILVKSDLKNMMNDKLKQSSTVRFDGSSYLIKTPDKTLKHNKDKVSYSSASIYFEEPVNRKFLFSENYGINLPIIKVDAHKYMVKVPNGDKNYYTYENGRVTVVEFDKSIINVKMVKLDS